MEKKNIVVIGYGEQGTWHCQQLEKSDVLHLSGIYDIDETRRKAAEEKGIHAYPTYEAVLNDPLVDAVTIAVPNDSHFPLCMQALQAGKNVVCEKPVMMNSTELQTVIDMADAVGRVFTVHQNRRWDNEILAMKQLVDSGELGNAYRIESRVHGSYGVMSWWRQLKEHGGGMMYDWGVHLIDQVLMVFPAEITRVYCELTHITNQDVDDGFRLTLTNADGKELYLETATNNLIYLPRFYLLCNNGTALIPDWGKPVQVARRTCLVDPDVVPVETSAGITKTMAPRTDASQEKYTMPLPSSDVHDFYRNFCAAIDGTAPLIVTHEQSMRVMKVMEAAFESADCGMPLSVKL